MTVAVNVAFCTTLVHVCKTARYNGTGYLRQMLLAALILNLLSTTLAAVYHWRFHWQRRFTSLLAGQLLLSSVPFALVRGIRIPQGDLRLHVFGALYALLVYLHVAGLVTFGLSNTESTFPERRTTSRAAQLWVFAVSILIYSAISPWVKETCWPTADEPHYLLLTHSLVFDHDFDLANNYARNDYKVFYPVEIPRPAHHTVLNGRGQEVPVHDVGISILLVPGYALRGRLGAMLELNVFGALLALGIFQLGLKFDVSNKAAMACWGLFAFTSPIVVYVSQIYPETVGAGAAVWAMVAYSDFSRSEKARFLLIASSLLAILPWLSVRYWLIIGPMLSVMTLNLLVTKRASMSALLKGLAMITLPLAFSTLAFCLFDLHWYQTAIPNAGYVLLLRPRPSLFTHDLLPGLPGLLFDRAFGLLATAPVYMLAIAGAAVLCRRRPWQGLLLTSPAVAYVLFAAPNKFWYGGWAPPPRYIVTGVALLAPAAALILASRVSRILLSVVAGWSFFIATAYMAWPLTRYTHWTWIHSALSQFLVPTIGFNFDSVFPSFIRGAGSDYLLCLLWLLALLGCVWKLSRQATMSPTEDPSGLLQAALTKENVRF